MTRMLMALVVFVGVLLSGPHPAASPLRTIRVGYFQNDPIVFKDHRGTPQGLYVDLLNQIAESESWRLEFVFCNWNDCLDSLRNRELDLMTSITRTEERDRHMDFSDQNVLTLWGQVYVKDNRSLEDIRELDEMRVAILKNGVNGINFKKLIDAFGVRCHLISTESYEAAVHMVISGYADACVLNNVHGSLLKKQFAISETPVMFNPFKLLFAAPEGENSDILNRIDHHIENWKTDKDSFYYKQVAYWYGTKEPAEKVIPKWVISVFLVTVGIIVISLLWLRALHFQIRVRKKAEREKERLIVKLQNAIL